jgi:hypothetical protein
VEIVNVEFQGDTELAKIAGATDTTSRRSSPTQRRQQQRRQDSDYGYDYQQLDKRERPPPDSHE